MLIKRKRLPHAKRVDLLVSAFDFARVRKAMVAVGWKWRGARCAPSENTLRAEARRCLMLLRGRPDSIIGCGGFKAITRDGCLALEFHLSSIQEVRE